MIDTIVMRIHNLNSKYSYYINYLENYADSSKTQIKIAKSKRFGDSDTQIIKYYADTHSTRYLTVLNAVNVASSNYNINFFSNKERDYLEVSFSVPKYLFGTNVFQFTDHRHIDIHHIWTKLDRFLLNFFSDFFPKAPDYKDVEINRIDFCLNQIFDTKEDALKYLARQKELNISYARSDRNKFNDYGSTTIQYVTDNYGFKVYHKGTEFRSKGDLKPLQKYNPRKYDIDHLTKIADRTLRYEMTYRSAGMNYVFKQKVKDDINTMFNHNLSRIQKSRTKAGRKFVEHDVNSKTHKCMLATVWDEINPALTDLMVSGTFTFNYELFYSLHAHFMKYCERYKLDAKLSVSDMYEKLKEQSEKNKAIKGKGDNSNLLIFMATLSQYQNMDSMKEFIPNATFYRLKKKLQEAQISLNTIDGVYSPPLDFSTYLNELGQYHRTFN